MLSLILGFVGRLMVRWTKPTKMELDPENETVG
jgi:hypothetical protein